MWLVLKAGGVASGLGEIGHGLGALLLLLLVDLRPCLIILVHKPNSLVLTIALRLEHVLEDHSPVDKLFLGK